MSIPQVLSVFKQPDKITTWKLNKQSSFMALRKLENTDQFHVTLNERPKATQRVSDGMRHPQSSLCPLLVPLFLPEDQNH